jgi:hypothetical protein
MDHLWEFSGWVNRDFLRYLFDVAVLGNGDIILVWAEPIGSTDDAIVRQLCYNDQWGASTVIDTTNARGVELLADSAGTLHLVYWLGEKQTPSSEGRGSLVHRMYNGSSWSASVTVDNSSNACCPRMAAGTGSEVYMVWERQEGEQVVPIWNKYVDGTWDEAQILGVCPEADAWYPTADLLPDGDLVIAWSSRSFDRVTIETTTLPLEYYLPIIFKQ